MRSGSLAREIDLDALVQESEEEFGNELKFDFQSSGIVTVRFGNNSPAYSIYRTGSFQIRGQKTNRNWMWLLTV
jgi:transcription initiation factor TFIID TATA-box-binding protein